ncbi:hypothetical protein U1Q18_047010 [Sarracenia purpurea var. burkii]
MSILKYQFTSLCQFVADSQFITKPFMYSLTQVHRRMLNLQNVTYNEPKLVTVYIPSNHLLTLNTRCRNHDTLAVSINSVHDDEDSCSIRSHHKPPQVQEEVHDKSFWGAVGLIIGTAVGPGMLGLPAATIRSGPLPSTIAILLSWVYVISSIILVAEISFAAMEEDNVSEVSFTGLTTKGLGSHIGAFVALVYASLSFSLLVACVSGIGSIVCQWFPGIHPVIAHAVFPFVVGIILWFFPFKVIDAANRFLCFVMLLSISALVVIGLFVGRMNILASFAHSSWALSSVLPSIPVTVLTLGFHVITPFICKIAGNSVNEARRAILLGGLVPLIMVLWWNLIVLGLAGTKTALSSSDPISLLLSVNPSALLAIQGFAFSALATSFIGYAVSFPKQLLDTLELIYIKPNSKRRNKSPTHFIEDGGKVGFVIYSSWQDIGNVGRVSYSGSSSSPSEVKSVSAFGSLQCIMMPLVIGIPVLLSSFFRSTFSRALDFAGIYANCFLFGILPPVLAYIYQSRKNVRYVNRHKL